MAYAVVFVFFFEGGEIIRKCYIYYICDVFKLLRVDFLSLYCTPQHHSSGYVNEIIIIETENVVYILLDIYIKNTMDNKIKNNDSVVIFINYWFYQYAEQKNSLTKKKILMGEERQNCLENSNCVYGYYPGLCMDISPKTDISGYSGTVIQIT